MTRILYLILWISTVCISGEVANVSSGTVHIHVKNDVKNDDWRGYEKVELVVHGHIGFVVIPRVSLVYTPNNPWIWRTEFFDHEPQGDLALLDRGFHVAYVDVQNMYGAPAALDIMDEFYEQIVTRYNLSSKVVLEGFSRGGLFAFNWAARNPYKVAAIYADAPVLDFKSWPSGYGKSRRSHGDWQRLLQVYNLTEGEALAYKHNPINNLAPLASANIPILCICGGSDTVVPFEENTAIAEERYTKLGGKIKVIVKVNCGHHPHSLIDPSIIIDFVVKHTNVSNSRIYDGDRIATLNVVDATREYIDYCWHFGFRYNKDWNAVFFIIFLVSICVLITIPLLIYYYTPEHSQQIDGTLTKISL